MRKQSPSATPESSELQLPKRRRGGQELPDDMQDRPEQNAGYDAAVRGEGTGTPVEMQDEAGVLSLDPRAPEATDADLELLDPDRRP